MSNKQSYCIVVVETSQAAPTLPIGQATNVNYVLTNLKILDGTGYVDDGREIFDDDLDEELSNG